MNEAYNSYEFIDEYPNRILEYLMTSGVAEDLWKLIKYDSPDALSKPNLTINEKRELIWNNGDFDTSSYRMFLVPMSDNLQNEECSNVHIFVGNAYPENRTVGTLDIFFQFYSHFKLSLLDFQKMRQTAMLRSILKSLNGIDIQGLGKLFFNRQESIRDSAQFNISNNRNYHGYFLVMSLKCGGRE